MKFTLVSQSQTSSQKWHINQLEKACQKAGLHFEVINPVDFVSAAKKLKQTDIIFWRSGKIADKYPCFNERVRLLINLAQKGVLIINKTLFTNPLLSYKSVQQELVKNKLRSVIHPIPTYLAADRQELKNLIKKGYLSYPFIAKLNYGSEGRQSRLISQENDLEKLNQLNYYIYQNFIPNDGDYRVMVIGGVAIGIMKRVRNKHPFLNNISQGGQDLDVSNPLKLKLTKIASKIVTNLDLTVAGVDLIYHSKEKKWYFLEVNTINQWQGLQKHTSINIAEKLVENLVKIRLSKATPNKIRNYYFTNLDFLSPKKQVHFLVRQYLSNPSQHFLDKYPVIQKEYPASLSKLKQLILTYLKNKQDLINEIITNKPFRQTTANKYPWLGAYHKALLSLTFSQNIHHLKTSSLLYLLDKKIIKEYNHSFIKNPDDVLILSTYAVNFLYFSRNFYPELGFKNPEFFLDIADGPKPRTLSSEEQLISIVYLLTHAIINASRFYSQPIKEDINLYLKMIKFLEKTIANNYFSLSLDHKLEFLVCARLLNYSSFLEKIITNESHLSLSPHGCYLIDKLNSFSKTNLLTDLDGSEHRNSLFLMAFAKNRV